jgi:2-polyprenyl-6-hydroxyphenyl methylase/3-demethylubiquinone-9 3-methyltransferase
MLNRVSEAAVGTKGNIDEQELARFSAAAVNWWDPKGEFGALHQINPVRLRYVIERADLAGRRVLDVGCGGGLMAEGLAAAGAQVTGIDMATAALDVAREHLRHSGLAVDYRQATVEAVARDEGGTYDTVTCMELVEHVPDPASIVRACGRAVKPGGHVFFATVNRTWLSRLLVIWFSESVLGIVRKGTHQYHRLVRPTEIIAWAGPAGLKLADLSGLRYIPFLGIAALCSNTRMNYLVHFKK